MASNVVAAAPPVPSEYSNFLLGGLYAQLKTGDFCDIRISVLHKEFPAHKNILAAASPYFHAMFAGGMVESNQTTVDIQGTNDEIFEKLLKFMYTGDIEITEESCQDLLTAADLFGMSHVLESCCLFLQKQLDPSNCFGIYELADAHFCVDLKRHTEEYICTNFVDVTKEEEFFNSRKETLIKFLSSEHLHVDKEIQVLSAAMDWINYDLSKRRTFVFEILCSVRFPLISKSALDKNIDDCSDLGLKIAVRKIAQDFNSNSPKAPAEIDKLRKTKPWLFKEREGVRKSLMAIGGLYRAKNTRWIDSQTLSSVEMFDTYRMYWSEVPSMKYNRSSHGTVVLNGLVYVLGGENDSLMFDSTEIYDRVTSKWTIGPSMTTPRCALGAAVVDDCIYVMGGWVGSKIGTTIEKFNPQLNVWTQIGKMATPRLSMGVVAYEGLIYVVGGIGASNTEVACLESYNPVTKEWCTLASMHTKRAYVAVCAGAETIYAIGGSNHVGSNCDTFLSSVEKYDIAKNEWTVLTEMKVARAGAGAAYLNNMLYVFGGRADSGDPINKVYTLDIVDCYDLETQSWFVVDCLNYGRCDIGVVIL